METAPPPSSPATETEAAPATEIAFFDVETSIPSKAAGTRYALLEFGAIVVCLRRLVEVGSYSTLIRPENASAISSASVRCNGITADAVSVAPSFSSVADNIYAVLHGRVWAGHNIVSFDCARIREAFAEIGRPPPEAKGLIDTLPLLRQKFGRRAGDMKMASLASYFGLGHQKHRSLDDVRMNLEVLKYCATVLFLESSHPEMYSVNSLMSESSIARNQVHGKSPYQGVIANLNSSSILEASDPTGSTTPESNRISSDLISHIEQMKIDSPLLTDRTADHTSSEMLCTNTAEGCSGFLNPLEVSTQCISATQTPLHQFGRRIVLLHKDAPLQLCCTGLRVQFGISSKFIDHAGRPKLSIVVDAPANLCQVLEVCDHHAHRLSLDSGSSSEWKPVARKNSYSDSSNVRLNIPTAAYGDDGIYSTEIYQKEEPGSIQKLIFRRLDAAELDALFVPGTVVDAYFSLDSYDYHNSAGIRLVAKKLVVYCK